jgi:glycosyltransferase involved in cell wall biosynthesis
MKPRKNILVYRDLLLPASETFILAQGERLSEFRAHYMGARRTRGIDIPADRCVIINDGTWRGRAREALFKVFDRVSSAQLRRLARLQPALVHAHFGPDGVLALKLAELLGVPLVVTFHGLDATVTDAFARKSFYTHRKFIERRGELMRRCARIVAISEFIKRKLLEQGAPPEKVIVHYIGVDTERFRPARQVTRAPIVLFVGRLVEQKGCDYVIRAMAEVQAAIADAELVVIGDGPLRAQLETLAFQSLRKYRFLGMQPSSVIREWLERARVFCGPSFTPESGWAEGFGIVFAEAQAMGVPVVSSRNGGITEAVAHDVTGLLCSEKDWRGLAAAIARLLTDDALWQRMSAAGRERVVDQFDLKKQTRILEGIYAEVASQR